MSESTEPGDGKADASEELKRARTRLNEIWSAWGLELDTSTATVQMDALQVTHRWLATGETEPARVIRSIQYLLSDPERPGIHQRAAWAPLKNALVGIWGNVATKGADMRLLQALVVAAWGDVWQVGGFVRAELMDSAWDALARRPPEEEATIHALRSRIRAGQRTNPSLRSPGEPQSRVVARLPAHNWTTFDQAVTNAQAATNNVSILRPHVVSALQATKAGVQKLEADVAGTIEALRASSTAQARQLAAFTKATAQGPALLELLWWGQARYSRALQKSYRRFAEKADIPFWAAWEASELAFQAGAEVEPAAAYLVEVLDALHLDMDEKKPLRDWMSDLAASLERAEGDAPPVAPALEKLAAEDALGLPVTWVRLQTAARKPLDEAGESVALDLGAPIDRGQWAAWLFRESLLDRHFRGDPA